MDTDSAVEPVNSHQRSGCGLWRSNKRVTSQAASAPISAAANTSAGPTVPLAVDTSRSMHEKRMRPRPPAPRRARGRRSHSAASAVGHGHHRAGPETPMGRRPRHEFGVTGVTTSRTTCRASWRSRDTGLYRRAKGGLHDWAMAQSAVIELRGLDKSFRTSRGVVHAARGVDLSIRAGEVVAPLGRTALGSRPRSTCCSGWREPDAGSDTACLAGPP